METEDKSLAVEIPFRQFPIYNSKGLRFNPVELDGGKIIDWNMVPGPNKRKIKKQVPGLEDQLRKQLKEMIRPIEVIVYGCPKCDCRINAFVLDEGKTPLKIPCKCGYPMAEKKFTAEKMDYSTMKMRPDLFFRYVTQSEYAQINEQGQKYIAEGGLFMELAK